MFARLAACRVCALKLGAAVWICLARGESQRAQIQTNLYFLFYFHLVLVGSDCVTTTVTPKRVLGPFSVYFLRRPHDC